MIEQFYDLSRPLLDADERALALCREQFARLEEIKEYNQLKMLRAFTDCGVGGQHLVGTTGYGTDDPAATSWSRYLQRRWGPKRPCSARVFSLARTR